MSALLRKFTVHSFQFIVFLLLLLFPVTSNLFPTYAQESSPSAFSLSPSPLSLPAYIPPTSPLYTDLFVYNMFHSFSCIAIGRSTISQPCLSYRSGLPVLSEVDTSGGLLGATGNIIGLMYTNPPIKSIDYLAMLGEDLGIRQAHAQVEGSGGEVLSPVVKLWQVSRNVAYLAMIFIFVIIGLMVMFRQKINPQTVITAQAALPGLVIGLLMITFSYFFASLISDTAFIGTNLVGYYFSAVQDRGDAPQDLLTDTKKQSILALFSQFVGVITNGDITHALEIIFNNSNAEVQKFMRLAAGAMAFQFGNQAGHALPFVGDLAGIIVGVIGSAVTAGLAPQVLGLVFWYISVAILIYSMLKLLLRLINSYLTIVWLTLSAPFHFLAASLPGRQELATNWMLNMLANVLVFPAVLAVLYFVAYILQFNKGPFKISSSTGLINPAINFPAFGGLDSNFINTILAFGALMALPSIPDIVVRTIGKVGVAGQLLGQEVSGNLRGGQGQYSQATGAGRQAFSKIASDYEKYRGVMPGHSPAEANLPFINRKLSDITFGGTPIYDPVTRKKINTIGGWKPFSKKT